MKEEIKIEITKKIGSTDAPGLISKLEELGVCQHQFKIDPF